MIDEHFGQAESFTIWEVAPYEAYMAETVQVKKLGEDEEDKIESRVALLKDCVIVYTMQIGGPAAAKLVANRIHPMKTTAEVPVAETVLKLQQVLNGNPPPWLKKAMLMDKRAPFSED